MKNASTELGTLELEAVRLVHRHNEAFGRQRLAEVLAGRRTGAVQEHELDGDPAFGTAADKLAALAALDRLLERGWLRIGGVNPKRPLVALGEKAARSRRVTADNPRHEPPARLEPIQRAQLRRLARWRDLIALEEALAPGRLATMRGLRVLLRHPPASAEELDARAVLGADASRRFRRAVLEVLHGTLGDPTAAEVAQTLVARAGSRAVPITRQIIEWGRTPRGSFTKAQLALIGVAWPPAPGWKDRLGGVTLSQGELRQFLEPGRAVS